MTTQHLLHINTFLDSANTNPGVEAQPYDLHIIQNGVEVTLHVKTENDGDIFRSVVLCSLDPQYYKDPINQIDDVAKITALKDSVVNDHNILGANLFIGDLPLTNIMSVEQVLASLCRYVMAMNYLPAPLPNTVDRLIVTAQQGFIIVRCNIDNSFTVSVMGNNLHSSDYTQVVFGTSNEYGTLISYGENFKYDTLVRGIYINDKAIFKPIESTQDKYTTLITELMR